MAEEKVVFTSTEPVVIAHPSVITPKAFKQNGKEKGDPKYGFTCVFEPDSEDFKRAKLLAISAAKAKWPGRDIGADFKAGEMIMPWESGDEANARRLKRLMDEGKIREDDHKGDYQLGKMLVKASSKYPIDLSVIEGGRIIEVEGDAAKSRANKFFYFGVEGLVELTFVAYNPVGRDGKAGVTAYAQKLLSTGKGEKLTAGRSAVETFGAYAGKVTGEDPGTNDDDFS